jgi:hypothetical protein
MLSARPRPSIAVCAGSIFIAGLLTSVLMTVLATVLISTSAATVAFSGQTTSGMSTLRWLALVGGLLVIGRTVLAALLTQWFVTAFGSTVSLGRCFAALLAGTIVNVLLVLIVVQQAATQQTMAFSPLLLLTPFVGFALAVAVLHGGGPVTRAGGDGPAGGYSVPPEAPQGWLGTGDSRP